MPSYRYTAFTSAGARVAGVVSGASEAAALAELESRALTPSSIALRSERRWKRPGSGVSVRRLAVTYAQLADVLRAGVPILRGLKLLAKRRSHKRLAAVFTDLAAAVEDGDELSNAMSRHPDVFPRVHVAMVRSGEKGGFLETVLTKLAELLDKQAELRAKVAGNLVYPCVLLTLGSVMLGVIFGFFVPMFRTTLAKTQTELPLLTKVVFAASDAITRHGLITVTVLGLVAAGVAWWSRRPGSPLLIAKGWNRTPMIGWLLRSMAGARFCRMLGTLLENGIPMLTAMQIAKESAGHLLMEEAIEKATDAVRSGEPLAPPLAASGLFADDVVEMISMAESANNLDSVLVTIAQTIEGHVDRALTTMVRLIEPLLLLAIGGVAGVVAAALILPMMQMRGSL